MEKHAIQLLKSQATGLTPIAAFDSALTKIGIENFNLITLSSVIPPNCEVVQIDKYIAKDSEHGLRLYCVKADARSERPGECIAAALGWYQWGEDSRGIFVEHEEHGANLKEVEEQIRIKTLQSVKNLCTNRNIPYEESRAQVAICSSQVIDQPIATIVVAVYQSEPWSF